MQKPLVLPADVVGHYLMGYRCQDCGRPGYSLHVRYPAITLNETEAELLYPVMCGCGGRGCVRINMPTLLFGYVLARTHALLAYVHARRSRTKRYVTPQPSPVLERMVADFAAVVAAYNSRLGCVPTELDRAKSLREAALAVRRKSRLDGVI